VNARELDVGLNPLEQLGGIHRPRLPGDLPPALKHGGGGDAADLVALSEHWVLVGIDFGEPHAGLELGGRLFEEWSHHLAGTAPGGPEVHHERKVAARHVPIEGLVGQDDRLARKQGLFALTAERTVAQARAGNAVGRLTAWANDD
jgi:hypothetical protein